MAQLNVRGFTDQKWGFSSSLRKRLPEGKSHKTNHGHAELQPSSPIPSVRHNWDTIFEAYGQISNPEPAVARP